MSSEGYHEPISSLTPEVMDRHRAITSIMEELEAVDWYDQRVAATSDDELGAVLAHNRDEEKEHAAMVIEWLRRNDPVFDRQLRRYLFTDLPITSVEDEVQARRGSDPAGGVPAREPESSASPTTQSLGIGSLKPAISQEDPQ